MNYTKEDYKYLARKMAEKGICAVPLRNDSKLPSCTWKRWQTRVPNKKELEEEFNDCGGLAVITGIQFEGSSKPLFCLDFDLKYQLPGQDYYGKFMEKIPEYLKEKLVINTTKNGGMHIIFKSDYVDKSRKLTRRLKTVEEIYSDYRRLVDEEGIEEEKANRLALKNNFAVIIETRSSKSYWVAFHKDYERVYGTQYQEITVKEAEFLVEIAYSLDMDYSPRIKYTGDVKHFGTIRRFNEDTDSGEILRILEQTGMFSFKGTNHNGDIKILRAGSKQKHSGVIFNDNSVLHVFSQSTIFDTSIKNSFSPFEVYCTCHDLSEQEAIEKINKEKQ